MKKVILGIIILITLPLTACSSTSETKNKSSKEHNAKVNYSLYQVKSTKTTSDSGEFILQGTTAAPDGSKIVATPLSTDNVNYNQSFSYSKNNDGESSWATVKDGKFNLRIDPIDAYSEDSYPKGQVTKILLFAVDNYQHPYKRNLKIPKNILTSARKKFNPIKLTIDASQAKYFYNLLEKDKESSSQEESDESSSSSDSDDSDESSSSDDNSSADEMYESVDLSEFAENPEKYSAKQIKTSGTVVYVQQKPSDKNVYYVVIGPKDNNTTSGYGDGHGTVVEVNIDTMEETPLHEGDNITVNGGGLTSVVELNGKTVKSAIVADSVEKD